MSLTIYGLRDSAGVEVFRGTIDPPPGGGSQPEGALCSADFLFTEEATADTIDYTITVANDNDAIFTVAGSHVADFPPGQAFTVVGSTGNDGAYTVASAALNGGSTEITVNEGISSAVADGAIQYGRYTATLPILAGTVILDVFAYPVAAPWAADEALLTIGDVANPNGFYDALSLKTELDVPYVRAGDTDSYATMASDNTSGGEGLYSNSAYSGGSPPGPGAGAYYEDADTITLTVVTRIAAPPAVPAGITRVKVIYFTPATTTDVALA